jgi:hypothetical protein
MLPQALPEQYLGFSDQLPVMPRYRAFRMSGYRKHKVNQTQFRVGVNNFAFDKSFPNSKLEYGRLHVLWQKGTNLVLAAE